LLANQLLVIVPEQPLSPTVNSVNSKLLDQLKSRLSEPLSGVLVTSNFSEGFTAFPTSANRKHDSKFSVFLFQQCERVQAACGSRNIPGPGYLNLRVGPFIAQLLPSVVKKDWE
jgi:hypothetical protein